MSDEPSDGVDEPVDELLERYDTTLRQIGSLPEIPMRRAAVAAAVTALEPDEAVWWIDQLIRGALWGKNPEMDAILACADWLVRLRQEDDYGTIATLYEAAAEAGRESVLMMLRDPPAHRALRNGARLPETRLPIDRDVSLGERRSMARGQDRRFLERLILDPSPLVVGQLLENPAIRLPDVVTIAARRPTVPELVLQVALAPKWFRELQLREAIVQNPFAATGLALKLMPTLNIHSLRKIRHAGDLHPMIREFAELLVQLREQRTAPWKV